MSVLFLCFFFIFYNASSSVDEDFLHALARVETARQAVHVQAHNANVFLKTPEAIIAQFDKEPDLPNLSPAGLAHLKDLECWYQIWDSESPSNSDISTKIQPLLKGLTCLFSRPSGLKKSIMISLFANCLRGSSFWLRHSEIILEKFMLSNYMVSELSPGPEQEIGNRVLVFDLAWTVYAPVLRRPKILCFSLGDATSLSSGWYASYGVDGLWSETTEYLYSAFEKMPSQIGGGWLQYFRGAKLGFKFSSPWDGQKPDYVLLDKSIFDLEPKNRCLDLVLARMRQMSNGYKTSRLSTLLSLHIALSSLFEFLLQNSESEVTSRESKRLSIDFEIDDLEEEKVKVVKRGVSTLLNLEDLENLTSFKKMLGEVKDDVESLPLSVNGDDNSLCEVKRVVGRILSLLKYQAVPNKELKVLIEVVNVFLAKTKNICDKIECEDDKSNVYLKSQKKSFDSVQQQLMSASDVSEIDPMHIQGLIKCVENVGASLFSAPSISVLTNLKQNLDVVADHISNLLEKKKSVLLKKRFMRDFVNFAENALSHLPPVADQGCLSLFRPSFPAYLREKLEEMHIIKKADFNRPRPASVMLREFSKRSDARPQSALSSGCQSAFSSGYHSAVSTPSSTYSFVFSEQGETPVKRGSRMFEGESNTSDILSVVNGEALDSTQQLEPGSCMMIWETQPLQKSSATEEEPKTERVERPTQKNEEPKVKLRSKRPGSEERPKSVKDRASFFERLDIQAKVSSFSKKEVC